MGGLVDSLLGLGVRLVHGLFARLPLASSLVIAAGLGRLYARVGGPRVSDARINLEIAFPDWTPRRRREVLVESFANHGRSLAEVCVLGGPQEAQVYQSITFEGLENLEAALAASHDSGVLVVSAHLGSWELCATSLARRDWPISVVHHEFANREFQRIVSGWRLSAGLETLQLGKAAYGIYAALRRGRYVGLLMDQNASLDDGVFAPFFGRDACTRAGPMQLAMHREVPVVPIFIYRQGGTGRHIVRAGRAIPVELDDHDSDALLERNVARMNAAIEAAIRRAPDQWIWSHRRYRTRPPGGMPSPYPARRGILRSVRHRLLQGR